MKWIVIKKYRVLPCHEFEQIQELLQDAFDVCMLRAAKCKKSSKPSISLAQAKKRMGL